MTRTRYWHPDAEHVARLCRLVETEHPGLCIDIGASAFKFPVAHETLGWEGDRKVDFCRDRLPYDDGEVAFAFCRHTCEDLSDPTWLLSEIRRVARAGYIETPSPVVELCRGVDADGAHLGYIHHRWVCHSAFQFHVPINDAARVFTAVAKYPCVEACNINDMWPLIDGRPDRWNTRHLWTGPLNYRVLECSRGFDLGMKDPVSGYPTEYLRVLGECVKDFLSEHP